MFKKTTSMIMYLIIAVAMFGMAACSGSYDDTIAQAELAEYYGDETISPLIQAAELKAMLEDPAIAPKVIILDASANSAVKATIPTAGTGAKVINPGGWTRPTRNEGYMTVSFAIADGYAVDGKLREWGVQKDSIIVFTQDWTQTGASSTGVTGWWWVLHYWGFSKKNLKVLDGGNAAYMALVGRQHMGTRTPPNELVYSTFSVKELPGDRIGGSPYTVAKARATLIDVRDGVINNDFVGGRKIFMSTLANAMYAPFTDEQGNQVSINAYGHGFMGRVKGQKFMRPINTTATIQGQAPVGYVTDTFVVADPDGGADITYYRYKNFADMRNTFLDRDKAGDVPIFPTDKSIPIWTHCGTGTTTMPFFFAMYMAGYHNAAPYAGSGAEWFTMAAYYAAGDNSIVSGTNYNLVDNASTPDVNESTGANGINNPANPLYTPGAFAQNAYPGDLSNPSAKPPFAARNSLGMAANFMLETPTQFLRYNGDDNNPGYIAYNADSTLVGPAAVSQGNGFVPGTYNGIWTWDMTKYSDYVIALYNANPVGYSSEGYIYHWNYTGEGDEVRKADLQYKYGTDFDEGENNQFGGPSQDEGRTPGC